MRKNVVLGVSAAIAFMMMSMMVTVAYALPHADARVIQHTYTFSIGPGGYWTTFSFLNDDVYGSTTGTGYFDKFVMTVTSRTHVHIEVVDCCLMGDTIALGDKPTRFFKATSPEKIIIDHWFNPGVYTFFVGYIPPHTEVFPAGYDIYVWGS